MPQTNVVTGYLIESDYSYDSYLYVYYCLTVIMTVACTCTAVGSYRTCLSNNLKPAVLPHAGGVSD